MPLIIFSSAWVLGIFIGSLYRIPWILIFTGVLPLAALIFTRHYRKPIIITALAIFIFFGGVIRYTATIPDEGINRLQDYTGQSVAIRGIIDNAPEVRDKTTHLEISATAILVDEEWVSIEGRVLLYANRTTDCNYGDTVEITGYLAEPPEFDGFNYRGYLANRNIFSVMIYPEIEVTAVRTGFSLMGWIYGVRDRLADVLVQILPEPQASLAQGILLGLRGNIPQSLKDNFSQTGTSHILAISGQNLSILAGILVSMGIWLFGRRHYIYIWLALAIIVFYTILTGLSAPVVRASVMAGMFLFAELFGRQRSAFTGIAFAAAIMVGISPVILHDASFQLSFLAMAGLVFIAPFLQNLTRRAVGATLGEDNIPARAANIVLDGLIVSLAAVITVWPVIAYYFDIVSLVAPLATLLALPAFTGIIMVSAVAALLGMAFLPLGIVIGWLDWLLLSYFLLVVKAFTLWPVSYFKTSAVDGTFLIVYYAVLITIILLVDIRKRVITAISSGFEKTAGFIAKLKIKWGVTPLAVIAVLLGVAIITLPDDEWHVSFMDVGQGDAILIQHGSLQVLVDGGPSPQAINLELGKRLPFWDRTIELVVTTHPDADHLAGLEEVLYRYNIGQVMVSGMTSDAALFAEWEQLLAEKGIGTISAQAGQRIVTDDGMIIEVLNPAVPFQFADDVDDNGVVLRVTIGEVSFLLTGDISGQGEFALITNRAGLQSTVLKVAHHGSAYSTTAEFLAVVQPQIAVISVGADNSYGHPAPETLDRLNGTVNEAYIYRTDESGTIEFITDGERLWVREE
ncbi:MAG: DNA internalization-related competence protein ComEC/Rec2 [Dehalococcoidales bacterium]|nr:DNA internalization-related competence protein ComEC/Rec2 [Dehalococcoidales bacterium]